LIREFKIKMAANECAERAGRRDSKLEDLTESPV
jgi:hypothetical protein